MAKKIMEVTCLKLGIVSGCHEMDRGMGTYRVMIRGIIAPLVMVSTRRRNGMMDSTLWCEENGMNQCTTRLWAQTNKTKTLMGRIHNMRMRIEWA